jgi:hypothetical protein
MAEAASQSDVGAVVLTVGEGTTSRALASLQAQTLPVSEVVVVEGVAPMARALNTGAERVTTPFFLQVDADMVLHPRCAEVLRGSMTDSVGIAVGTLADPLMGRIVGIKMFARACFDAARVPETVAQDVDFGAELARLGWSTRWILGGGNPRMWGPLGEHRPDYEAGYVFATYHQLGARYVYRDDLGGLLWRRGALQLSGHAMAPVARLGIGCGVPTGQAQDAPKARPEDAVTAFLRAVALARDDASAEPELRGALSLPSESRFAALHDLGARVRARSPEATRGCVRVLGEVSGAAGLAAEAEFANGVLDRAAPGAALAAIERLGGAAVHDVAPCAA